jgi:hypothetical protein
MFGNLSPRTRRLVNSLAYSALVTVVMGLGYLTFRVVSERRQAAENGDEATAEPAPIPLVDFDSFSTRREKTSDAERLSVSLRLRLTAPGTVDCYVYVLARNDHVSPKLWGVWPTQGPGGAISAAGHFRSNNPTTGSPVQLTSSWTRITATIDHPPGHPPFDTVMVYVVSAKGEILLARPFAA